MSEHTQDTPETPVHNDARTEPVEDKDAVRRRLGVSNEEEYKAQLPAAVRKLEREKAARRAEARAELEKRIKQMLEGARPPITREEFDEYYHSDPNGPEDARAHIKQTIEDMHNGNLDYFNIFARSMVVNDCTAYALDKDKAGLSYEDILALWKKNLALLVAKSAGQDLSSEETAYSVGLLNLLRKGIQDYCNDHEERNKGPEKPTVAR